MNNKVAVLVAVSLVAVGVGGYWLGQQRGSGGQGKPPGPTAAAPGPASGGPGAGAPQAVTVEAARVVRAALPQVITAVGSLRSDESVTLRPEVAGRIAMIGFAEGQRVQKGALLVRLDPTVNEAEVKQARANMTLAKSKYDRAVDLAKSNFISGQARDEAESNMKVADAALAVAEAKLAKTEIKAPFSGIIGLRQVSVGDYVKEGADLVNLEAVDPLKVDFRVPEIYLKQVRAGQALEIALDAIPGRTYAGRVFAINPLVDAAGRAIVIRAQVSNPDTSLRPGMFARVRLITEERRDALVVPEQALVPFGSEQFVFRVVDGKAQRARVEIGQRGDGKVEIRQGVGPEDVIVVAGQLKLRDGVTVTLSRPLAQAAAGNGKAAAPQASAKSGAPLPPAAPDTRPPDKG
ncbi:MAG: efflux RND transporter periplasmic adaptor subunit [Betaproteobacteria bacterium]|nr:efflux RND transporter periplasmic adaptor subunit [Betaproteobacteria bacterium]